MVEKTELAKVKAAAEIKAIARKAKLQAWGDYIGFGVTKIAGLTALVTGGFEKFDPTLLPVDFAQPETALGIGLALLVGNKAVDLVAKALNAIKTP